MVEVSQMKNLAEVFKQWRWAEKMTTREAAQWIGIPHSTYWRMEQGKPSEQRKERA
jgi:DNA-binding XRE family transcriptional regulator